MKKINIAEKLNLINDHWNPRMAAELNGQQIRLVKVKGSFDFHKHENEDEMFLVIKGTIKLEFKDKSVELNKGEFMVVPKGVLHRPKAEKEAELMVFVSATGVNTGNITNDLTMKSDSLERI